MATRDDLELNKFAKNTSGKLIRGANGESYLNVFEPYKSTPFQELKTVQRFAQIELKSAVGELSELRNYVQAPNGGVTVATSGEYRVFTDATLGAETLFESGERGRYIPGYQAECGMGVRIPAQTWSGTQKAEWGYINDENGIGFGVDSGGVYIFIKRESTVTKKVYQQDWNKDTLDGSLDDNNPSGYELDLSIGLIYQIEFVWYGYGPLQWFVNFKDANSNRGSIQTLVHTETPNQQTSIAQPNLPITVLIDNGDQSTSREVFVGGRQFSVYGVQNNRFRLNGDRRSSVSISAGAWTPLISFRRKTGEGNNQSVQVFDATLLVSESMYFTFVLDGTLTGASFGNLTDVDTTETTLQSDTSATAITGGIFFGGTHLAVGGVGNTVEATSLSNLDFDFVNNKPVTLVARTVDGSTGTVSACTFNVKEQW